MFRVYYEDF